MENIIVSNITQVRVRYAETDKMGFVYNGEYLTFFEVGRSELMRSIGLTYKEFEKDGYLLPLVESYVRYKNPAYYDDLLSIKATMSFELKAVIKINYNIFRGDTTIVEGFTVHSFMNSGMMKPVKPPKTFVDAMIKAGKENV